MTETCLPIVNWLKNWFYGKSETDTLLSGKQDTLTGWETITLTNGTLYVNTDLRLCELHYSTSNGFTTANTWTFIETVSEISNYPPTTTLYAQGSAEPVIARLFDTGSIQALCRNANTTLSVTFNLMWHY